MNFFVWLYFFMKVRLFEASETEITRAKHRIAEFLTLNGVVSVMCVREALCSLAFLTLGCYKTTSRRKWPHDHDVQPLLEDDANTDERELFAYILQPQAEQGAYYNRVIGTLLVTFARRFLTDTYTIRQLPVIPDTDAENRLLRILTKYSSTCTYARTKDLYLHLVLRSKLLSWRNAIVPSNETPYEAMNDQYGDDVNTIETPYITASPTHKILRVDWRDGYDQDAFQVPTHSCVGRQTS